MSRREEEMQPSFPDKPMYVVVEYHPLHSERFQLMVFDCYPDSSLDEVRQRVEQRRREVAMSEVFELVKPGDRESAYRAGYCQGRDDEAAGLLIRPVLPRLHPSPDRRYPPSNPVNSADNSRY